MKKTKGILVLNAEKPDACMSCFFYEARTCFVLCKNVLDYHVVLPDCPI